MKTMGLSDLALVRPKHFPSDEATARAAGADDVLATASVHDDLAERDRRLRLGRRRERAPTHRRVADRRSARGGRDDLAAPARENRVAVLMGPEQSGLTNDDLARCQQLVHIPANPEFSSLNLAMAVQVLCYELRMAAPSRPPAGGPRQRRPARDGRRARRPARAPRAPADGVRVPAPGAPEAGQAEAAAHLSQGDARVQRAQHPARRADVARSQRSANRAAVMSSREIYLDYAATAPLDPPSRPRCTSAWTREFGNPSSQHAAGRRARALVEAARAAVARARRRRRASDLIFTSGATESNNLALQGVLRRSRGRRVHLVTSRIEHKSVLDVARALEASGVAVTYVPATAGGWVEPERVVEAIDAGHAARLDHARQQRDGRHSRRRDDRRSVPRARRAVSRRRGARASASCRWTSLWRRSTSAR